MQLRCPQCHHPNEIVDDSSISGICCDSCGSHFDLVADETLPFDSSSVQTVGHFVLKDSVGYGSFGTVWKAQDVELDRTVAIKIPRKGRLDAFETEKFLREARAVAQLNHPNIVSVHEVGREGDNIYIVSDYVEGVNLSDRLTGQRFTWDESVKLIAVCAEALNHAHERGVVHRDLKPSNVMIDAQGEPHIMDFGLAKREIGEITMTVDGKLLGTPAYMPPEQATGAAHQADRRADVYSLGVILFELLTGERPFRGNMRMLLHQVVNEPAPSPRKYNNRLPKDLETVCLKCLEKDPERRYETAGDLADDLNRYLRNEPIKARSVSRFEHGWRWCRRNPLVASLTGATATLLVLVAILSTVAAVSLRSSLQQEQEDSERARQLNEELNATLYARQIVLARVELAESELGEADLDSVNERLEACPPERRQFEWFHLKHRALGLPAVSVVNHPKAVWDVDVSPNGDTFCTACVDGAVRVYDLETLELIDEFRDPNFILFRWLPVISVAYSPDGNTIAFAGASSKIHLWDLERSRFSETLPSTDSDDGHEGWVIDLEFSEDGRHLASASWDGTAKLWSLDDPHNVITFHDDPDRTIYVNSVAIDHSSNRIATGSFDGEIAIWNRETGARIKTLSDHFGAIRGLRYLPDGKQLVSASMDGSLKIWDVESGKVKRTLEGHTGSVLGLSINKQGTRIASGSFDNTVRIWDVETGEELLSLTEHSDMIWALDFTDDDQFLVSGSFDRTVRVWHGNELAPIETPFEDRGFVDHGGWLNCVDIDANARQVASGGWDRQVRLWSVDGQTHHALAGHSGEVWSVAYDHDGSRLASASWDWTVRIWDLSSRECTSELTGHSNMVHCVAFGPPGSELLATGDWAGTVIIWDLASGQERLRLPIRSPFPVFALDFSHDGQTLATGSGDGDIRLWDVQTGNSKGWMSGHTAAVHGVKFSDDDSRLASAGWDKTIRIWDVARKRSLQVLDEHTHRVNSVAFQPQANRLASASEDRWVLVWDLDTGEVIDRLRHRGVVWGVAFSSDGNTMVSAGWTSQHGVRVWQEIDSKWIESD